MWLTGLTLLLSACANNADNLETGGTRVIDRAIAAHGGDRLARMTTVVTECSFDDSQVFESRGPVPPWDRARRWEAYAIDFGSRRYADARYDSGGGYEWITGTVYRETTAYRLDYRNRSYRRTSLEFDDAIADAMVLSPLVLLRWLTDHRELTEYTGQRREHDTDLQILKVIRKNGHEIEISFELDSGRIHGLESGYTDYDGSHVPLHFRYADWRTSDGVHYPTRVEVSAHGYVARRASLAHVSFGESITMYLDIPESFIETANEAKDVRDFRLEEIADGVYFVGEGVMYQLIVEFDDFLVALDGSSGDVTRRIDAVRERIPDKPFRYVLASHHHNDHLHGLDDFAMRGSTVLASPEHAATVTKYVEERLGRKPEIVEVTDQYIIDDGDRELYVMDIGPTPHSEYMLAAYLPREKILFAADLFVLGGRRTPVKPAMPNGLALFDWISSHDLDVERIVDPHSPLIATMADLQRSIDKLQDVPADIASRARSDLTAWRTADKHVRRPLGLQPVPK